MGSNPEEYHLFYVQHSSHKEQFKLAFKKFLDRLEPYLMIFFFNAWTYSSLSLPREILLHFIRLQEALLIFQIFE
jgi:hypothetical protein